MTQSTPKHLRIVIIDDDAPMRNMLQQLAETIGGEVIGEGADGPSGLELVMRLQPDLLLLDVSMPGMNGFAVARQLRGPLPGLLIIFVSQHADRDYAEEAFRCGAKGYILKRAAVTELYEAVVAALEGRFFCSGLLSG